MYYGGSARAGGCGANREYHTAEQSRRAYEYALHATPVWLMVRLDLLQVKIEPLPDRRVRYGDARTMPSTLNSEIRIPPPLSWRKV